MIVIPMPSSAVLGLFTKGDKMSESELIVKKKAWCSNCEKVVSVVEIGSPCAVCGTETEEMV